MNMKKKSDFSRREFLATIATVGAGVAFTSFPALAADEMDPKIVALVRSTMGIDTHNHIDVPLKTAEVPSPTIDLTGEMKRSGLSAVCATFALDYQRLNQPGMAYERFLNALTSMDVQLARNKMKRALNLKDLQAAHDAGQPVVIQDVEGAHFLEGQLDRLQVAYQRGLRIFGLFHDSDASVPLGDVYTNPPKWGGLTDFGASVVKECNRLGILIDLMHASPETVAMAIKVSSKPISFTHTGLNTRLGSNPRMAQMMRPRLLSKEHVKVIADNGGVVGVWTHLVDSPAEYVEAIKDMVDVAGIDHVCIGTDTKLTVPYDNGKVDGLTHPGGPSGGPPNNGTNRFGGGPPDGPGNHRGPGGHGRMGERTNEIWPDMKAGFYYAVVEQMVKQGFTDEEISKVGGGNFCRVFDDATAGH
jgi:membrane dipeptidase